MSALESVKAMFEGATGLGQPSDADLETLVRERKPSTFRFRDDGFVPNHPEWPLVIYRGAVRLPEPLDPAAVFEVLFKHNGWQGSWRNGIYDYVHYHSGTHEVLGVARGSGTVRFGGGRGRTLTLKAGDVAILPAGTGHQGLLTGKDFLVVGAYPPSGRYDECTDSRDHARAVTTIRAFSSEVDPAHVKKMRPAQTRADSAEGGTALEASHGSKRIRSMGARGRSSTCGRTPEATSVRSGAYSPDIGVPIPEVR